MKIDLEKTEDRVSSIINEIVDGNTDKSLWATATNALRKDETAIKSEISDELQGAAQTQYNDMLQIIGADANNSTDAEKITKKVVNDTTTEVRDMFSDAGVVNKYGFYSTFERYEADLKKAVNQTKDSEEYESQMEEYLKKTTKAGIVYKDEFGRARDLQSGVNYTVRKAESALNIALAGKLAEEMGATGMYISWHPGHRPSHDFGGQTFTMEEYEEEILPQLEEPNCRHMAYPVFLDDFDITDIPEHLRPPEEDEEEDYSLTIPSYYNPNDFNDISKAFKETQDKSGTTFPKIPDKAEQSAWDKLTETLNKAKTNTSSKADAKQNAVLDYIRKSVNQIVAGNYTDDVTLAGTLGQIGLGLLDLDLPADIRDIAYDLTHWEGTWEHAGQTLLDAIGLLPVIGAIKNADEVADVVKGIAKNGDEAASAVKGAAKNADDLVDAGSKTGKFIDNTTDTMTKGEKQVVDDLVEQGKTVERIPKDPKAVDKSPDFKVNGVKTELKTLENANTNTGMKRIQEGFKQHAETVIIDARGSGLTSSQATEIINRASGKYPNGQLPGNVEIWIDGQVITNP